MGEQLVLPVLETAKASEYVTYFYDEFITKQPH